MRLRKSSPFFASISALLISMTLMMGSAMAALTIEDAVFDWDKKELNVHVTFSGGCAPHYFELEFDQYALQSFPVQQGVRLAHTSDDTCAAIEHEHIIFDLTKYSNHIAGNPADLRVYNESSSALARVGFFAPIEGTVVSLYAIGGETTGVGIVDENNRTIEIEMNHSSVNFEEIYGKRVKVYGENVTYYGEETGERQVLMAYHFKVLGEDSRQ